MQETSTSYDRLPYPSYSFEISHPDAMAVIARLFGLNPATVEECGVLELGCAGGGNLIPMAFNLPRSRFLGIDLASTHVAEGRASIEALGLENIDIVQADILDVSPDWGRFDYIICHGLYSWVDEQVRHHILDICRDNLAEQGVAFISHNVYPGHHLPMMLREMLLYHTDSISEPRDRLTLARHFMAVLLEVAEDENDFRSPYLRAELRRLAYMDDSYVYHELLTGHNHPSYFYQFIEEASRHDLRYLGDASPETMLPDNQPAVIADVAKRCPDFIQAQQYLDFLRNRRFRHSLLCKAEVSPDMNLKAESVYPLHLRSYFKPSRTLHDWSVPDPVVIEGNTGERADITGHANRLALSLLDSAAPAAMPFEALFEQVWQEMQQTEPANQAVGRLTLSSAKKSLAAHLTRLYFANLLRLHTYQAAVVSRLSDRPRVSRLTQLEAERKSAVTTGWHQRVSLDPFGRELIGRLDGSRDRNALIRELGEEWSRDDGEGTTPKGDHPDLDQRIDPYFENLRRLGLLVG